MKAAYLPLDSAMLNDNDDDDNAGDGNIFIEP